MRTERRNCLKVRNIILGEGIPKICAPIMGADRKEIQREAEALKALPVDLAEWRADWFKGSDSLEQIKEISKMLREVLEEMPILFTFRSLKEGGNRLIEKEEYNRMLEEMCRQRVVDLIDVELSAGEVQMKHLVETAHEEKRWVVASNHEFSCTPPKEEMIRRLCRMQELGADLLKIAVMPQNSQDVLTLLQATSEMKETYAKSPLITISMAGLGSISRVSGEIFGSVLTFGTAGKASAPGQLNVCELKNIMEHLHDAII